MTDLLELFFPSTCTVCGCRLVEGEDVMCLACLLDLPRTGYRDPSHNLFTDRLASRRAPLVRGAALYNYVSGSRYTRLIHDTKYRHRPIVGRKLARMHAGELAADGFFDDIDLLLPIPLHPLRRAWRGYNQSEEIALGIAEATGLPVGDNLTARLQLTAQAHKSELLRRLMSRSRYGVRRADELDSLHILVVDDVVTTGSTMLTALEAIHAAAPTARLSAYALGVTVLK